MLLDFENAVNQALEKPPINYIRHSCPDQFVGLINQIEISSNDFPCRKPVNDDVVPGNVVVLILESPHQKEFTSPFGPAKGLTGKHIRRYLREVIADRVSDEFGLLLINAIENQCSLGCPTKKYRDAVFLQAWEMYGENKFIIKLQELYNRHKTFIINACTKGKDGGLRELVEKGVLDSVGHRSDVRITHPVSWASINNREATW